MLWYSTCGALQYPWTVMDPEQLKWPTNNRDNTYNIYPSVISSVSIRCARSCVHQVWLARGLSGSNVVLFSQHIRRRRRGTWQTPCAMAVGRHTYGVLRNVKRQSDVAYFTWNASSHWSNSILDHNTPQRVMQTSHSVAWNRSPMRILCRRASSSIICPMKPRYQSSTCGTLEGKSKGRHTVQLITLCPPFIECNVGMADEW